MQVNARGIIMGGAGTRALRTRGSCEDPSILVILSISMSDSVFVSVYTSPFSSLYNCFHLNVFVFFFVPTELKLAWGLWFVRTSL